MRTLSRRGIRSLIVATLSLGAVGLVPAQAQADPGPDPGADTNPTFQRFLSCTVAGTYTASAWVTFELQPDTGLAFHWKQIQYVTTPGFKADYVSFSYGKHVKVRFGQPSTGRAEVPNAVDMLPLGKTSALPAHITMKVLTRQGSCVAKWL